MTATTRQTRRQPASTKPRARRWQAARDIAVLAIFLLALALPGLATLFPALAPRLFPGREKRAGRPALHWNARSLAAYPAGLYRYFEDNFGFRGTLIRYHSLFKIHWLGVSPSSDILLGRQGWLYYAGEGDADCARQARPFSEKELAQWERALADAQAWTAARGMRLLVVFGPDKHTIYPEYLPANLRPTGKPSRMDQLITRLARTHPEIAVLDVRPVLEAAKSRYQVYYRLDSHWDPTGALVASDAVLTRLRPWFPAVRPLPWRQATDPRPVEDWRHLADMLGLTHADDQESIEFPVIEEPARARLVAGAGDLPYLRRVEPYLTVMARPGAPIPRAVIFGDSFSGFMVPYLSERIGRAVYCLNGYYDRYFDPAVLEGERPNLVIWEIVERRLMQAPPKPLAELRG